MLYSAPSRLSDSHHSFHYCLGLPSRKDLDSTENDVLVNGLAKLSATRNIGVRIRAVYVGF